MSLLPFNREPSTKQLRVFGMVWLAFLGAAAGLLGYRESSGWIVLLMAIAAVAVPLTGWAFPALLRLLYVALSAVTYPIGLVVSFVLLGAFYYAVVTPIGQIARLFGYDPMKRRLDRGASTYWLSRPESDSLERYFRQS